MLALVKHVDTVKCLVADLFMGWLTEGFCLWSFSCLAW